MIFIAEESVILWFSNSYNLFQSNKIQCSGLFDLGQEVFNQKYSKKKSLNKYAFIIVKSLTQKIFYIRNIFCFVFLVYFIDNNNNKNPNKI